MLVISARNILPQDLVDKLLILSEKFSNTEREQMAAIIRAGMKSSATQVNDGIRSMKKVIREMKSAKEKHTRAQELLPSFS